MANHPFAIWKNEADIMKSGYVCRDGSVSPMQFDAKQFPTAMHAEGYIKEHNWVNSTEVRVGCITAYVVECHLLTKRGERA